MNANEKQVQEHELTHAEVVTALNLLFDAWLESENATPVEPIAEYLEYAKTWLTGGTDPTYNVRDDECVFIVNTNGDLYGIAHAYETEYLYGNIFKQSLDEILASAGRARAVAEAEARVERNCSGCKYFGACSGHFAASATPQQQSMLAAGGCPVASVMDHIVERLDQVRFKDQLAARSGQGNETQLLAA
jgi:radical SAM protein with 4Fe4S-binding SPASM domain